MVKHKTKLDEASKYQTNMWKLSLQSIRQMFVFNRSSTIRSLVMFYLVIILPISVLGATVPANRTQNWIFTLGIWGVGAFVNLVALEIALASFRHVKLTLWEALNLAMEHFLKYLGYFVVYGALIVLGLFAFVVPGLVFAFWYSLIFLIMLKEGGTIGPSFVRSRHLVKGRFVEYVALVLLSVVLSAGGLLGPVFPAAAMTGWYEQLTLHVDDGELPAVAKSSYLILFIGGALYIASFILLSTALGKIYAPK